MILALANAKDAAALARTHARSFDLAWSAADIETLLTAPGGYAVVAREAADADEACGFLLARAIAGEAEILTLAVDPAHRRQGLARALIEAAAGAAIAAGTETMFLEVAADNPAAPGLYQAAGFDRVGSRKGYYARPGQLAVDALVLRRTLNSRAR